MAGINVANTRRRWSGEFASCTNWKTDPAFDLGRALRMMLPRASSARSTLPSLPTRSTSAGSMAISG